MSGPRGTSNTNDRGSAASRRARKIWILSPEAGFGGNGTTVPCYRADTHCDVYDLTFETMQVDRIIPGAEGGRYTRDNIRPACAWCNHGTGTRTREKLRQARKQALLTQEIPCPFAST